MALRKNPNQAFEALRHAAAQARLPFDREAWLNLAFYLDQQYVDWDKDAKTLRPIPRPKDQQNLPRPIVNKVMHYVQQAHATVLQDKPSADVLPADDEILSIGAADLSKAYCTYVSEPTNANWDRQLARAALWAMIAGNGWMKFTWSTKLERPDIIPPSYFEVFPDPYAKEFGKARYVIHSQFMDREQVYELWGKDIPAGASESIDPQRASLLQGMGSAPVLNGVTVNELWAKPSRRHPKGQYVVWSGTEQLVPAGDLPYEHLKLRGGRLPFTHIGCIERPDSLFYRSPVSYLRSAQMLLNKYHAQKVMNREAFANAKWWVPSELDLEELPSDKPRQVLRGISMNGQLKPELIAGVGMPDNGDGAMIEEQMMHIVGQHEVSQAQVPGRVEAAKAIELLKESDEGRYKAMLDTIDQGIAEGWWQTLMLAKQFEKDSIMLQCYSPEGLPEIKRFKKDRINPGMKIKVVRMNGLGRTRAQRQDNLMLLWQNWIIQDPSLMAELMEVPIPSFTEPKALDMRLARNENLDMAAGQAITPNSWDDHAIHLREHNDYRKTSEFLLLPQKTKTLFEYHCEKHEELAVAVAQKNAQLMMAAQGIQPQPPGGAPPGGGPPDAFDSPQGQAEQRTYQQQHMVGQGVRPVPNR
ncbi:MAG: portal protein [Mycobacteriaceae bacterium]